MDAQQAEIILSVRNLGISIEYDDASLAQVLSNVEFDLLRGETLGIVGESGCGKSLLALSLMRLLPQPYIRVTSGQVNLHSTDGAGSTDIMQMPAPVLHAMRGKRIAMIFQDPMLALNPVMTIERQLHEVFALHFPQFSRQEIYTRSCAMLKKVGISEVEQRLHSYPHQLSGGLRQRVMIAMALACEPEILIADEPTTALDVTIQAQILKLIKDLQKQSKMAVIFITHDLGVITNLSDRIITMYAGQIVEAGRVSSVLTQPLHPYTRGLFSAIPQLTQGTKEKLSIIQGTVPSPKNFPATCRFAARCPNFDQAQCGQTAAAEKKFSDHFVRCSRVTESDTARDYKELVAIWKNNLEQITEPARPATIEKKSPTELYKVTHLNLRFPLSRFFESKRVIHALSDVTLELKSGETLGVVGETGCGKTSLGRTLIRLYKANEGSILFQGQEISSVPERQLGKLRDAVQMVFQDSASAMNSRLLVGAILEEPLSIRRWGTAEMRRERAHEMLTKVGLGAEAYERYPHEFSGGQRQRIAIARALMLNPAVLICDEPVSALDVSVQSQILNLLLELQSRYNLALVFISHDLSVVHHISDRILIMYLGYVVESASAETIYTAPRHPYTAALIQAIPQIGTGRSFQSIEGELPSAINLKQECVFLSRCPIATEQCRKAMPPEKKINNSHSIRCWNRS